jgi:Ankyrin repeats (3 copies)
MSLQHPNTNVNARTFPWKFNPLQLVCQDPKEANAVMNLSIVQELLNHPQIDIMTVDYYGCIPLHAACCYQERDGIMEKLLLHKSGQYKLAQLNTISGNGQTPLHYACSNSQNDALVRLLMNHANEMNINAMNFEGNTPLYIISYHVTFNITPDGLNPFLYRFQQLLQQPAILIYQRNKNGSRTAFDVAKARLKEMGDNTALQKVYIEMVMLPEQYPIIQRWNMYCFIK